MQNDLKFQGSSYFRRYTVGLLSAVGVMAVRIALMPLLGTRPPYITFYVGIVIAAAYGGMGPGFLVMLIGMLYGFVTLPAGPVVIAQEATRLGLYLLSGLGICLIAEGMHRQRRRVQEQAQDLERVVRMLDLANVFVRDSSDRIIRWNSGCWRLYGYRAEEALGRVSHDLLRTRFPEPKEAITAKLMSDGNWRGEFIHIAADGREVVVTSDWVLHRESAEDGFSVIEVVTDITGRKRAEEALRENEEHLRQLLEQQSRQAAMGEMINNIAHQWRQPLNTLGLIVQSLPLLYETGQFRREELEQSAEKAMEVIRHMSETINDFGDYFKPDKEKIPFHATQVVSRVMKLTCDHLKSLDIVVELVTLDDPVIFGYPNQFGQVLLNILLNARDAMIERSILSPKISITIGSENGGAVITISDNAGGIPENIIGNIFEPYFTTKDPERGTGIGLFMSRTIIEKNMGGRLLAYNKGNGAEFRIEL